MAKKAELSPLALYSLAAVRESDPGLGPWSVVDDPEDLFLVHLTGKTLVLHVRAGARASSAAQISTDGGVCPQELRDWIRAAFADVWFYEKQADWSKRVRG